MEELYDGHPRTFPRLVLSAGLRSYSISGGVFTGLCWGQRKKQTEYKEALGIRNIEFNSTVLLIMSASTIRKYAGLPDLVRTEILQNHSTINQFYRTKLLQIYMKPQSLQTTLLHIQ